MKSPRILFNVETESFCLETDDGYLDCPAAAGSIEALAVELLFADGSEYAQPDSSALERELAEAVVLIGQLVAGESFSTRECQRIGRLASLLHQGLELLVEHYPDSVSATIKNSEALLHWTDDLASEAFLATKRPYVPTSDGTYLVSISRAERRLIETALELTDGAGLSDNPETVRLFPQPYTDDEERNEGWNALAKGELIDSHERAANSARDSLDKECVDDAELEAIMRCLNDARLILGTRLDVSEDDRFRRRLRGGSEVAQYESLSQLVAVIALTLRAGD